MDSFGLQPQNQNRNTFGPPAQLYLPPKDHKKKVFTVILCVAAVILAAALGGWVTYTHSASYKVKKGFLNLMREAEEMKNPLAEKIGAGEIKHMLVEDGAHLNSRLNVTTGTVFGEVTLGVDTECETDRRQKEMALSTNVSVMNYELASMQMYGDQ